MSLKSRKQAGPVGGGVFPPRNGIPTAVCLLLAVLVFLVFGRTLGHEFINLDDNEYVYDNPVIQKGFSPENVVWAFTRVHAGNWHPLTTITHMLDCQAYGLRAGGHHLTNVLLHIVGTVMLFLMLMEMTGALWRSGFVAAVFAIHPLRVESVAWVAERKDVLSGVFFVLTLWAYLRYVRGPGCWRSRLWVLLWFVLGLLAKPMLVTVPFLLLLLDYWPMGRFGNGVRLAHLLREKLPLFALSALSCISTLLAQKEAIGSLDQIPLLTRLGNALVAYAIYPCMLFFPANLALYYPLPPGGWPLWKILVAALVLGCVSWGVWRARFSRPYGMVGWFWYLGMLVPVVGMVQVGGQAYADRYSYLPLTGLVLAIAWGAGEWTGARVVRRRFAGMAAVGILCVLSVLAGRQANVWKNSETLWRHALECTGDNSKAHDCLGGALFKQGRIQEAMVHFQEAVRIDPANSSAWANLGGGLLGQGRTGEAMTHLREALRFDPGLVEALNNLGNGYCRQGQSERAMVCFQEAIRIKPDYAEAHSNLGGVYASLGRFSEAVEQYRITLRLNPSYPETHNNLGNAFSRLGRAAEAVSCFEEALRIRPDNPEVHNNLGWSLLQLGKVEEAMGHFRETLRMEPSHPGARVNLGCALFEQGRISEAISQYRDVIQSNPGMAEAYNNLGNALFKQGKFREAIAQFEKALEIQPSNAATRQNLAWMLATAPQPELRDGARAVQLARQACAANGDSDPLTLYILSAAQAESGDFRGAIRSAEKAIPLAEGRSNAPLVERLNRGIRLYQKGRSLGKGP